MRPVNDIKRCDLVLVGGGHAHVFVLKRMAMRPVAGLRVTLISREVHTPYSGMLPGLIAGHYAWDDIHIDLAPLCAAAGARLIAGTVHGIDLDAQTLACDDRPPVRFDLLSLDCGSSPAIDVIEGADQFGVAVKPISRFLPRWQAMLDRLRDQHRPMRLAVVGGGAGSVELALAVDHRLREVERIDYVELMLISAATELLPAHDPRVRARIEKALVARGIAVHRSQQITAAEPGQLRSASGQTFKAEEVLWVTQAGAPAWPAAAGLDTDQAGFVSVRDSLQSVSHPNVFAAGDIANMVNFELPKAGVFAVRQGPVLAENLTRAACGRALRRYAPQKHFLALISTGNRHAVASRGRFFVAGHWVWRWKDWIDRRFMAHFRVSGGKLMQPAVSQDKVTNNEPGRDVDAQMRCGGCGSKLGGDLLARVLARLHLPAPAGIVTGIGEDAAVIRPVPDALEVQTVDGFRAMIDDPFIVGQIGAEHAINDVYAMGGTPRTAMAWVSVPAAAENQMEDDLYQLLAGVTRVCEAAGVALIGGHSSESAELTVGLAVTGYVDERDLWRKARLCVDDYLVLTKPIGTGALLAAHMRAGCSARWLFGALRTMQQSNRQAAHILRNHSVVAVTDITGFGLLGHVGEMTRAARLSVEIMPLAVPVLPGARNVVADGTVSSLQEDNERVLSEVDPGSFSPAAPEVRLLFDPQTSGGLLAAVSAERVKSCVAALRAAGYHQACVVGRVRPNREDGCRAALVSGNGGAV